MDYIEEGLLSKKINKKRIDNLDLRDKEWVDDELNLYKDENGNYPDIKTLDNDDKQCFKGWMAERNKYSYAKKINKKTDKDYIKFGIKNAIRNAKRGRLLGLGKIKAKKILDKYYDMYYNMNYNDRRYKNVTKNINPDKSSIAAYSYGDIIKNKLSNTSDRDIIKQELKKKRAKLNSSKLARKINKFGREKLHLKEELNYYNYLQNTNIKKEGYTMYNFLDEAYELIDSDENIYNEAVEYIGDYLDYYNLDEEYIDEALESYYEEMLLDEAYELIDSNEYIYNEAVEYISDYLDYYNLDEEYIDEALMSYINESNIIGKLRAKFGKKTKQLQQGNKLRSAAIQRYEKMKSDPTSQLDDNEIDDLNIKQDNLRNMNKKNQRIMDSIANRSDAEYIRNARNKLNNGKIASRINNFGSAAASRMKDFASRFRKPNSKDLPEYKNHPGFLNPKPVNETLDYALSQLNEEAQYDLLSFVEDYLDYYNLTEDYIDEAVEAWCES